MKIIEFRHKVAKCKVIASSELSQDQHSLFVLYIEHIFKSICYLESMRICNQKLERNLVNNYKRGALNYGEIPSRRVSGI